MVWYLAKLGDNFTFTIVSPYKLTHLKERRHCKPLTELIVIIIKTDAV
jgi:hypothetical protein